MRIQEIADIRVLLVEAQSLVRLGIRAALKQAGGFTVAGESETSEDGIRLFAETRPDVVVLGLRLRETCAVEDLDRFKEVDAGAKIVIIATHAGDGEITQALKKGALGYLLTNVTPEELADALRLAAKGKKYIPREIAGVVAEHIGQEPLTATEKTVLRMITEGRANKEIAYRLDISENTVKTHVRNIFDKLRVADRTAAATAAIKRGLVRVDH
jgi:DNA-binding NarL/FixJ family response regulator